LVVDNLLNVEIVLASGEVVHASKDENADLFWAIRGIIQGLPWLIYLGGGCNFGVVTVIMHIPPTPACSVILPITSKP